MTKVEILALAEPEWWRLKQGLQGLKPYMSNASVRRAKEQGYAWPQHYEPVCRGCSRLRAIAEGLDDD